jgi:hypothetical protein
MPNAPVLPCGRLKKQKRIKSEPFDILQIVLFSPLGGFASDFYRIWEGFHRIFIGYFYYEFSVLPV